VFPVKYELNLYTSYVEDSRLRLWSSGQSSCLQNGDIYCDSCEIQTVFMYVI
jgi:hypothetical protein